MHVLLIILMTLLGGCGSFSSGEKVIKDVEKVAQDGSVTINDVKQTIKDVQEI